MEYGIEVWYKESNKTQTGLGSDANQMLGIIISENVTQAKSSNSASFRHNNTTLTPQTTDWSF
jgi:hypothetical protein